MAPKRKANEEDNVPQSQAPAKKAREQNPPSELEQGDRASSTATDSYGYPFEAMQVTHTTTQEQRRALFSRWGARYALAQLSLQPEGFRAVITHVGGLRITFNLLSPPDMIAVCDAEGRWYRRLRNNETDGPRPYSDAFYQEYLRRYNLPPWFMRGGHLAMLEDTGEARLLGVQVPAPPRLERLSRLDAWMPVTPARPLPRKEVYQIEPRRLEREYLGRRFPAVLTDVPCNTYVLPTGHVMVLSRAAVDKKENVSLVGWRNIEWATENRSSIFASYKIECAVEAPVDGANERVRIRRRLRDAHVADGGIVNPTQIPAGLGHWDWLDRSDHDVAQENNFASPEEITLARGAGALSLNYERVDTPSVVFYPDPEYFNPREQPEGPGRWAFFTSNDDDSDETFAALNLGGVHGLPNYPRASRIFRLRQQYRAQPNREDLTAQFRLVWIPGEESSEDEGGDPVLSDLEPEPTMEETATNDPAWEEEGQDDEADEEDDDDQVHHGILGPDIEPSDFDPTNGDPGGKLDQTATLSKPRYYTCQITPKSRIVTLDRARPELGKVEEHKTWAYTRKGWQQYTHHAEIDWNDKKQLAALLRWRDQLNRRSGWPKLREAAREAYAEDERRWLEKRVRESIDSGVPYDLVELHRQFQAKFGGRGERTEMGIAAALLRIRKQFHTPGEQGFAGDHKVDEGSDDEQSEGRDEGQSESGEDPGGRE